MLIGDHVMSVTHLNPATDPATDPDQETGGERGAWLALSAALTDQVAALADREDLMVSCAPGAGRGAPACFLPALATIEIDGIHLGADPATCDPARPSDRERYPVLWGAMTHEAAHARHSRWDPPTGAHPANAAQVEAAMVLEESRIEAAQIARRPADRHWLRACVTALVLADFTPTPSTPPPASASTSATATTAGTTTAAPGAATLPSATTSATTSATASAAPAPAETAPAPAPARVPVSGPAGPAGLAATMTAWDAARAAGLLLARVDAGILDPDEVTGLAATITTILGPSRLAALAELWTSAHATADDDQETMLNLGRRWCGIVGADPDKPAPDPSTESSAGSGGSSGGPGPGAGSGEPSPLAAVISGALAAVAANDTPAATRDAAAGERAAARAAKTKARGRAAKTARRVFIPGGSTSGGASGPTGITGVRPPTGAEQAAARRLARMLRDAAHRDRTATTVASPTPPGRLRMREALAADAQRAAGAVPTARPFIQTVRRHVPQPPLRLGIACDVSGSMWLLAAPVASAAWILARAASHVPGAASATVIFGSRVRPVTYPGQAPAKVHEFDAADGTEQFCDAVDALDGALDLSRPGSGARLLVIVSDGQFRVGQRRDGQHRVTRLVQSGCAVLWLALGRDRCDPMKGAHKVALTDPADAVDAIGRAATHTLRHT
jgi:hypothetical protein